MKKIIISIIISFSIGIGTGYLIPNSRTFSKEIVKLKRGTYYSVSPEYDGFMALTIDGSEFNIYIESVLKEKGQFSYQSNNTFFLQGNQENYDLYYLDGNYVLTLIDDNPIHYVLEYELGGVVITY